MAAKDIRGAIGLAQHGRKITSLESKLYLYLGHRKECVDMKSGKDPIWVSGMPKKMAKREKRLALRYHELDREWFSRDLLDAIDAMDAEKFFAYGKAIERFRNARNVDPIRKMLLISKWLIEKYGYTMTIRDVAEMVDWPVTDSPDGFAQLRRLCKELKHPLTPSRQISRK